MSSAINRQDGLFLDDDGLIYPITNWFDFEGDECASSDAVVCVAGADGKWFPIVLSDYEPIMEN